MREGDVILLLHSEPSWSYLCRKMIPPLATAEYRVIALGMIGVGGQQFPPAGGHLNLPIHGLLPKQGGEQLVRGSPLSGVTDRNVGNAWYPDGRRVADRVGSSVAPWFRG